MKQVVPLRDRVIVKQQEAEEEAAYGVVMAEVTREKPAEGDVLEVGDGKVLEDGTVLPMVIRKGDHVLFGRFAGTEVEVEMGDEGKQTVKVMREDEILCVVREIAQ